MADIYQSESNTLISGTLYNDSITSSGSNVTIDANEGNDFIDNYGENSSINAGDGNDSINNAGSLVTMEGGSGFDSLYNNGWRATIDGGTGNDTITNEGENVLFVYNEGDGFDVISNYNSTSTLQIGDGTGTYSARISGDDVVVTVGEGKITLVGAERFYDTRNVNIVGVYKNQTDGDDTISNFDDNATINGYGGNDNISNSGNNVIINGGAGNDQLYNGGYRKLAPDDCGNSYVGGSNSTLNGEAGDDEIFNNGGENVNLSGGADNDEISNSGNKATIDGGSGNDHIFNSGEYYVGSDGDGDYETSYKVVGNYTSINGGDGSDTIENVLGRERNIFGEYYTFSPDNTTIEGGAGNDSISNDGSRVTISGGKGDDSIINNRYGSGEEIYGGQQVLLVYNEGDGNDYIEGFDSTSTLQIGDGTGTCSIESDGANLIVHVGEGKITLAGVVDNGKMPLILAKYSKIISGTEGADNITNVLDNMTINALGGDDTITNSAYSTTINGGEGNDLIDNVVEGDYSNPDYSSIDGGSGNDTITNEGDYVTIAGGKGDDSIENRRYYDYSNREYYGGENIVFVYNEGDGNDIIHGFKADSTLQIGDGTGIYSTVASGNDIIVSVGEGNITLTGAASLSAVNINGTDNSTLTWTLNGTTATYGNLVTVSGVKSVSGISLSGKTITVANSALNNSNVSVSNGYNLALANDVPTPQTTAAGWSLSGTTATYKAAATSAGYKLSNNQIAYTAASGGETFTVSGVKSTNGISLSGKTVTVANSALNNSNVSVSNGYNLALANDVPTPQTTAANWSLSGTTATYKAASTSAGYKLSNNQIAYTAASGGETFTVSGVKSTNGLALNGSTVTVANSALNNSNVSVSNGYNLALANDVPTPQTTAAGWNLSGTTATYKAASTSAGYKLSNNQVAYSAASGGETFTVSGVKSTNGISLSGKTITVANSALNNSNVSVSNGYNLALANDVPTPQTTAANWSLSGTTATYKAASTSAGYKLSNNQIAYTAASGGETFTVSGVKSLDGLSLDKKVVTVSKASLGTSKVTVSDGYTIKLADDVTAPSTKKAWSLSGTTATYKQTTNAGYTLDDNAVTYTKKSAKNLATVKGVKSTKGLSISDKVITVSKASLGTSKVTISGTGYTLKLGSDVVAPATKKAAWSLSGSTATYKSSYKTAGYKLASNGKSIAYSKATKPTTLATVKGVKSTKGLSVSGKVVTVSKASLGTSKVSISGTGYTLKLGKDATAPKSTNAWSLIGTTATYKQTTNAGYTQDDNAITYSKKSATNLATIKGAKSKSGLKISGERITLKNSALSKKVTVSGGYNFDFAADYKNATITGSGSDDTIIARGSKVSVNGGKGDDTIKILGTGTVRGGAGSDVFYYKSNGANVIGDYAEEDTISIASGKATTSTSGDDLILKVGKGKITVVDGRSKAVTYIDADGEHTYKDTSGVKFNAAGTGVTLTADYSEDVFDLSDYPDYKNKVTTINAAKVKHSLEITGNKNANKITGTSEDDSINGGAGADLIKGGAGNDSLWGNKGNDTLYGGDGDDTFIYKNGEGNDVIADFEIGDKIQVIAADIGSPTAANGDVTFTVGSGKLVIKGGADKPIQLYGENGGALSQKYKP